MTRSIAYLERYAEQFELPIELSTPVRSLSKDADASSSTRTAATIRADSVVVATGPFQAPDRAGLRRRPRTEVFQTHSAGYRRPSDLPEGRVLVVGGGNTGFQIAKELADTREVHLAIGSRQTPLAAAPARPRPLLVADEARAALEDRRLAARPAREEPRHPDRLEPARAAKRHGVVVRPRAVGADGRTVRFADGSELEVDAVIWATATDPTTRGSSCRSSATTVVCVIAAASPTSRASTSSASPGSTRAARRCSASSPTTRRSSRARSTADREPPAGRSTDPAPQTAGADRKEPCSS